MNEDDAITPLEQAAHTAHSTYKDFDDFRKKAKKDPVRVIELEEKSKEGDLVAKTWVQAAVKYFEERFKRIHQRSVTWANKHERPPRFQKVLLQFVNELEAHSHSMSEQNYFMRYFIYTYIKYDETEEETLLKHMNYASQQGCISAHYFFAFSALRCGDFSNAVCWFKAAALAGHLYAALYLYNLYLSGDQLLEDPDPTKNEKWMEYFSSDEEKALHWSQRIIKWEEWEKRSDLFSNSKKEALFWSRQIMELGYSPLHFLSWQDIELNEGSDAGEEDRDFDTIEFAFEHDFDFTACTNVGRVTPLQLALAYKKDSIVEALREGVTAQVFRRKMIPDKIPRLRDEPEKNDNTVSITILTFLPLADLLSVSEVSKLLWRLAYDNKTALGNTLFQKSSGYFYNHVLAHKTQKIKFWLKHGFRPTELLLKENVSASDKTLLGKKFLMWAPAENKKAAESEPLKKPGNLFRMGGPQ